MVKYCESCQLEVETEGRHCPECQTKLKVVDSKTDPEHMTSDGGGDIGGGSGLADSYSGKLGYLDRYGVEDVANYFTDTISIKPVAAAASGFTGIYLLSLVIGSSLFANPSETMSLFEWAGILLFGMHGVSVELSGRFTSSFGGLGAAGIATSLLFVVYVLYSRFDSLEREEKIIGFVSGYLVLTFFTVIAVGSGSFSEDVAYQTSLFEALFVMGIGVPVVSGLYGTLYPDIRSGELNKKVTAGYGISSLFLIPFFGPVTAILSGWDLWKRDNRKLGGAIITIGILFGIPALIYLGFFALIGISSVGGGF